MPRSSLTSSFSVSDANNEVVCPLKNNDGSNCRKRCLGEKRYRSMQEHIRRAHPSHYIPKLPATEESFLLMVSTPPEQRAHLAPHAQAPAPQATPSRRRNEVYVADASSPATPRAVDETPAAATAAVALAQLHHNRLVSDWESDPDHDTDRMRSSIELPSLRDHFKQDSLPPFSPRRELLPAILHHSPPGRSSTLPPIQQKKWPRPRKSSISGARKPKHERAKSKESARRPSLGDRKALSAEPQTAAWAQGKRWEDLIEAATSATEADDDRHSELGRSPTIPPLGSVRGPSRASLPPGFQGLPPPAASHRPPFPPPPGAYAASPLHKALTPPPYDPARGRDPDLEPFPSIESSLDAAKPVPYGHRGPSHESSPVLNHLFPASASQRPHHRFSNPTPAALRSRDIQIYCAHCKRPWALAECYACTECICGVCRECVALFLGSPPAAFRNVTSSPGSALAPGPPTSYPSARGCPRCRTVGGKWKAFQLDFK